MEKKEGYIKSRFSPSNLREWYNSEMVESHEDSNLNNNTNSENSDSESENDNRTPNIEIKNVNKKNNRSTEWRNLILKRYKRCVITGLDVLECDAAHIVPFKHCQGEKEEWASAKGNGLLLSKNLHWTFDRFYWSFDPNDQIAEDLYCVWLRIVIRPTKRRLTILNYFKPPKIESDEKREEDDLRHGYARVYKDSIPFLKIHYDSFLAMYNLRQQKIINKQARKKNNIKDSQAIDKELNHSLEYHTDFRIIKRKFDYKQDLYLYLCISKDAAFSNTRWLSENEGNELYGTNFNKQIIEFDLKIEKEDDPDYH